MQWTTVFCSSSRRWQRGHLEHQAEECPEPCRRSLRRVCTQPTFHDRRAFADERSSPSSGLRRMEDPGSSACCSRVTDNGRQECWLNKHRRPAAESNSLKCRLPAVEMSISAGDKKRSGLLRLLHNVAWHAFSSQKQRQGDDASLLVYPAPRVISHRFPGC